MGWCCKINSNQEITEALMDDILATAPEHLRLSLDHPYNYKQDWGWGMATNVMLKNNEITLSGSFSLSWDKAEPMRAWLKQELKKRGHLVRTTKPH